MKDDSVTVSRSALRRIVGNYIGCSPKGLIGLEKEIDRTIEQMAPSASPYNDDRDGRDRRQQTDTERALRNAAALADCYVGGDGDALLHTSCVGGEGIRFTLSDARLIREWVRQGGCASLGDRTPG